MILKTYSFTKNGVVNDVYTLTNQAGVSMQVLNYGARIISLCVPDRRGNFLDVIVGPKTPEDFYDEPDYFGSTVGRYCNRIENGKFTLNGVEYQLDKNQYGHSLHGGNTANFDRAVWTAEIAGDSLKLTHFSPDGAGGYPGNLTVSVTYTLTDDNAVVIDYLATTDKDTVVNLTHHSFFCLSEERTVRDHILMINADKITPVDDTLVPHGEFRDIRQTAFSFYPPKPVCADMDSTEPMIVRSSGYDLNYCLNRSTLNELEHCAYLYDGKSGRKLDCYTTLPGLQIFATKGLASFFRKNDYPEYPSVCLETQYFPNSPNCPNYPSATLKVGQEYKQKTVYKFSVE